MSNVIAIATLMYEMMTNFFLPYDIVKKYPAPMGENHHQDQVIVLTWFKHNGFDVYG